MGNARLQASNDPASAQAKRFRERLDHVPDAALATPEGLTFSEQAASWAPSMAGTPQWITSMLPTVMRLYPYAGVQGGVMLMAFSQYAASQRTPMPSFHSAMTDRWPAPDQGAPAYEPDKIFEAARTYLEAHPDQTSVLTSLFSMQSGGIAGTAQAVSAAAFKVWPHDRIAAAGIIEQLKLQFTEGRPATILTNLPGEAEQMDAVRTALRHVAGEMTPETRLAATLALLSRPSVTQGKVPDAELDLWLHALGQHADPTVAAAAGAAQLTENGVIRLWSIMVGQANRYQAATFSGLIGRSGTERWETALTLIVDSGAQLERLLKGDQPLTDQLLKLLIQETSATRKKRLAEVLRLIAPDRYVRSKKIDEQLSSIDRDILEGAGHSIKRRK